MVMEGQDEAVANDPISQAQAAMDAEQAGDGTSQAVTPEQFSELLGLVKQQSTELSSLRSQNQGLQGKIDTGLNAIRRDTQAMAEERILQAEAQNRETFLGSLQDPDLQAGMRRYLEGQDTLAAQRAQATQAVAQPVGTSAAAAPAQDEWAVVFGFVRDFGVDPQDPRVDYKVLVDQTLTEQQRRQRFTASLRSALAPAAPAAPSVPQEQEHGRPPQTPPSTAGGRGQGGYRNVEDVDTAFLADRIDRGEYTRLKAQFSS